MTTSTASSVSFMIVAAVTIQTQMKVLSLV